jgi:hypothetical protein
MLRALVNICAFMAVPKKKRLSILKGRWRTAAYNRNATRLYTRLRVALCHMLFRNLARVRSARHVCTSSTFFAKLPQRSSERLLRKPLIRLYLWAGLITRVSHMRTQSRFSLFASQHNARLDDSLSTRAAHRLTPVVGYLATSSSCASVFTPQHIAPGYPTPCAGMQTSSHSSVSLQYLFLQRLVFSGVSGAQLPILQPTQVVCLL